MSVLQTPFSVILLALRDQLASAAGLDPVHVLLSVLDASEVPHLNTDQDLIIKPGRESPVVSIIDGAGRYDNRRRRQLRVTGRTRIYLDSVGEDIADLTSLTFGHLSLEDNVCNALEQFWPTDSDGNALTLPGRTGNLSEAKRGTGRKGDAGWVYSEWDVTVEYVRKMDVYPPNDP